MKLRNILLVFLLCLTGVVGAQEVSFTAQADKTEVSVNERFVVQFVVTYGRENISVDKPMELPDFGKLVPLSDSKISSFQFSNGKVTNHNGAEILLVAEKEGEYKIGSATITIDGKKYKTEPITIHVKKEVKPQIPSGQRLQGAFLLTEISNDNPFVNQEVILTVKIFARDYSIIRRMRDFIEPDFGNLVIKEVEEKIPGSEKQVLIEGNTYISKELTRYIIFPQKPGETTIDSFGLNIMLAGYFGTENILISSEPLSMTVRNLPEGKPKNFSGAVGTYTLNTTLSKEEVKADEVVNLELEIIGSGNLNTLDLPKIDFPEHIETYTPKRRDAYDLRPSGMKGKVVETQILVPQYGGNYNIGPIEFSYFDPEKEEYITLKSDPFELNVDGHEPPIEVTSQNEEVSDSKNSDSISKPSSMTVNKINEVKEKVEESIENESVWVWSISGLLALLLLGVFVLKKNKDKSAAEAIVNEKKRLAEFRTGISEDLKSLKKLVSADNSGEFLSLQEEILTQIGSFYAGTELSDLTEDSVTQKLKVSHGDLADQWKMLFLECKRAKYAYGAFEVNLKEKYKETEQLWKAFRKS